MSFTRCILSFISGVWMVKKKKVLIFLKVLCDSRVKFIHFITESSFLLVPKLSYRFMKWCSMTPVCRHRILQLVLQCHSEWGMARTVHLWRFFWGKKKAWWLIDWLYNGFLIISGIRRGFLMTNKQHSINYTISKGIYGRNNQCRAKRERMPFFIETECHEPRG